MDNTFDINKDYPFLMNRKQAAQFLGVDPVSFDKYIRANENLERFMIGRYERYTKKSLIKFIESQSI